MVSTPSWNCLVCVGACGGCTDVRSFHRPIRSSRFDRRHDFDGVAIGAEAVLGTSSRFWFIVQFGEQVGGYFYFELNPLILWIELPSSSRSKG